MKKLFSLILVLVLCLGVLPMEALAGEIGPWKGGQEGHEHQPSTDDYVKLDDEYHQLYVYCTCGAEATMGAKEKHDLKYICPLTDDPEGRDIYECSKCRAMVFLPGKDACKHKHTTQKWDANNHWDECDDCHAQLNVKPHKQGKLQKDDSKHWYACTGCPYHMNEAAHTAQYWKHNSTEHWHECACGYNMKDNAPHAGEWDYDESKHWETCECGWESKASRHTMVYSTLEDGTGVSTCSTCSYQETHTVTDLSKSSFTGTKGDGEEYSSSEIKKVGLEGLKEGKDYTAEITTEKNDDGTETWVKTFKPIEGKTTGEKVFRGKKKTTVDTERNGHRLTVTFVAADAQFQNLMPPAVTRYYSAGKTYRVPVPEVAGLSPSIKDEVTGVMPDADLDVTVTYVWFYQLTIYLIYPSAEAEEGEGSWHETYSLPDGTEYNYPISELLDYNNMKLDTETETERDRKAGRESYGSPLIEDAMRGLTIVGLIDAMSAMTPDRDPVQGKIEGADKEETVRFTCSHPEGSYVYDHAILSNYSAEGHGTHDVLCGVCGAVITEDEPCEFTDTFTRVTELAPGVQEDYPNGAIKHTCSKCGDYYYEDIDKEACPGSSSGEPHDWTEWTKVDESHCKKTCNRCGQEVTQVHTMGEKWTSNGEMTHYNTCTSCNAVIERPHKAFWHTKLIKERTATEAAVVEGTCLTCGQHFDRIPTELLPEWHQPTGEK